MIKIYININIRLSKLQLFTSERNLDIQNIIMQVLQKKKKLKQLIEWFFKHIKRVLW